MEIERAESPEQKKDEVKMDGSSALIIGRGGSGKSSLALDFLEVEKNPVKIILVPQFTHPRLAEYDSISWPVMTAQELADAINETETDELVVMITEKQKGQPSIFKILRDPMFRNAVILADELAVLTSDSDDEREFKIFIRHVRQNNQKFFGTSHRIKDDMPPVTALNVQRIYYVGELHDDDEIRKLYSVSNVPITLEGFTFVFNETAKKYDWKAKRREKDPAVFQIYL